MRLPQFVPWDTDAEELIFASHTSIMSSELLISKMKDQGFCAKDYEDPALKPIEPEPKLTEEQIAELENYSMVQKPEKRSMNLTE